MKNQVIMCIQASRGVLQMLQMEVDIHEKWPHASLTHGCIKTPEILSAQEGNYFMN